MENYIMMPVFLCFDKNLQDRVSHVFNSVAANSDSENIEYNVVITPDVDTKHEKKYKDAGIKVHRMDMPEIKVNKNGIVQSPAMYLRWFIPYFTNSDKALYFDNDVVLLYNIKEMYDTKLGNNLIAAVKDKYATCVCHTTHHQGIIPGADHLPAYYSGQLLINCKLWRDEGIPTRLFIAAHEHNVLDMIALNYICADRIKELSPEWCISAGDEDVKKSAKLLHWHGRTKPWHRNCKNNEYYEKYRNMK
jgi:lipopolysaccharide biosynthesis glycosyltransferase